MYVLICRYLHLIDFLFSRQVISSLKSECVIEVNESLSEWELFVLIWVFVYDEMLNPKIVFLLNLCEIFLDVDYCLLLGCLSLNEGGPHH